MSKHLHFAADNQRDDEGQKGESETNSESDDKSSPIEVVGLALHQP
jgi:hypothetical protein